MRHNDSLEYSIRSRAMEIKSMSNLTRIESRSDRYSHVHCRRRSVQGLYLIISESFQFFMAVKPWRLVALQQQKRNIIKVIIRMRAECIRSKIIYVNVILQQLINDLQLAESVHSLDWTYVSVEFDVLCIILKQLLNIRKICVTLKQKNGKKAIDICQALNKFSCLRTLKIRHRYRECDEHLSSGPTTLFSTLRYATIEMSVPETEHVDAKEFAYKKLNINHLDSALVAKWPRFAPLCTKLAHLTITNSFEFVDLAEYLPANLISLKINVVNPFGCNLQLIRGPQLLLRRFELRGAKLYWDEVAVNCPNVNFLLIWNVTITGPVTSLPLTHLILGNVLCTNKCAFINRMCRDKLVNIQISNPHFIGMVLEYKHWIANPESLVGSYVSGSFGDQWVRKRLNNIAKVVLFFREALYRCRAQEF